MSPSPQALRRLRLLWRSAGWPYQDPLEAELLAAGWLERRWDTEQRVTVHLTDSGVQLLHADVQQHRRRFDRHEALVGRVARAHQQEGRIVWRGLSLRAADRSSGVSVQWNLAMPDVFSIRHTSRAEYLEPMAHEVKVQRSDLLSDLRRPAKGRAYLEAAGQCWYVLRAGIADPSEIPLEFGVQIAHDDGRIEIARAAPRHHHTLPFATWMALARACPERPDPADGAPDTLSAEPVEPRPNDEP